MDFSAKPKWDTISLPEFQKVKKSLRINKLLYDTFVLVAGKDSNSIPAEPS